jgi:hypothetical protein
VFVHNIYTFRYSLCSIKHVTNMDVSRHQNMSRYIYFSDMFYGTEGVQNIPCTTYVNKKRKMMIKYDF